MENIDKIWLVPGETLCEQLLEKLKKANFSKKQKSFSWYKTQIKSIFKIQDIPKINCNYKIFYAGFVIGEGSINVSAKKSKTARFGIVIDPEFSITQHVNGFSLLFSALCIFETGSIHFKSGSNATLVYRIDNRKSIKEKVFPFLDTYILPYISIDQKQRIQVFKDLLYYLEEKKNKDLHFFVNHILPLWDKLRKQKGEINETFPNLETARLFAINESKKKKGSSETIRDLI